MRSIILETASSAKFVKTKHDGLHALLVNHAKYEHDMEHSKITCW
jgi:hypothetical protein